jgi:hypothetical protein
MADARSVVMHVIHRQSERCALLDHGDVDALEHRRDFVTGFRKVAIKRGPERVNDFGTAGVVI